LTSGVDTELEFWGGGLFCLFHLRSFLMLMFAIGNVAVWGTMATQPPGSAPACHE